jgi:hypothetical protein
MGGIIFSDFSGITARMTGRESQQGKGKREFYEELCKI